ncbi:acyl carrier protein [Kitasatospora sp. RB6PN24]|uniref:acyl carrier protein n=1 Tax=Kitasatospora humi TaxID=2893891 RepID=UPI001E5A88CC|nr:acyl carrier protein [Kitasatospora humi]MCC9312340.1 acyl carrier protein [Kitasatospora humi]
MTHHLFEQNRLRDLEHLVAGLVAERLSERPGERGWTAEELLADASLCRTDFALLGLGSLDWMALATQVEKRSGAELTDEALLESEQRTVAGWAACLLSQGPLPAEPA